MKKTLLILASLAALALACSDDTENKSTDGGSGSDASAEKLVSDDELIEGCIVSTACGVQAYPSVVNCMDTFYNILKVGRTAPAYSKIYRCSIAAKGDCSEVKTCWGVGQSCDSTFKARCDGNKAISCDVVGNKKTFSIDCSAAGLKCALRKTTSATAYCTVDSCIIGTAASCVGNQVQSCNDGVVVIEDCAAKGLLCGYGGQKTGYTCIGSKADKCSYEFFVPQCKDKDGNMPDGGVASTPFANQCIQGREHMVDCTKRIYTGTKCKEGDCVSSGAACDKSANRCAGDDLEVCFDGSFKKYSCSAMNLGKCKTNTAGTSSWATCGDPAYP